MTSKEIGELKFKSGDLNREISIKEYLKTLLLTVWSEQEGFSGKRPFGNSGWDYDLLACLVRNKVIEGRLDEVGYVDSADKKAGHDTIAAVIKELL